MSATNHHDTIEHATRHLDGCINLYSGKKLNLLDPKPEMIDIEDIARGIARKPHFGGHSPGFFSVAQHSLMVCHFMQEAGITDAKLLLLGLLHDAPEAFIGDMPKPLKVHLPFFCEVEDRIMKAICIKYELDFSRMQEIKPFDIEVQDLEYRQFYKELRSFNYLTEEQASISFKARFDFFYSKILKVN